VKKETGLSLVELMVGLGLTGFIGLALMNVFQQASKNEKSAGTRTGEHSDIISMEYRLKSLINTYDARYSFIGPNFPDTTLTTDASSSRFLIPLFQQCRDLSNCPNDTSLMFINYNKKSAGAIDMVCSFQNTERPAGFPVFPGMPPNARTMMFDGVRTTYGDPDFSPPTVQQIIPQIIPGPPLSPPVINLATDQFITLFDGPDSTVWRVVEPLTKLNTLPPSMPSCSSSTFGTDTSQIYYLTAVPLKPNHLTDEYIGTLQANTLKLINVSVMTAGKNPDDTFGVNKCSWQSNSIVCTETLGGAILKKISQVRMDEEFRVPIQGTAGIQWYELGLPCSPTTDCTSALTTLVPPSGAPFIPKYVRPVPATLELEPFPTLLGDHFSFYKQNYLTRIRFRVKQESHQREIYIRFF